MNHPETQKELTKSFAFLESAVELTSYDDCNEALLLKSLHVGHFDTLTAPLREGTLIVANGDEHSAQRKAAVHFFTRSAVANYERDIIVPMIDKAMQHCAAQRSPDGLVRGEIVSLTRTILTRIAAVIVGLDDTEEWSRAHALSEIADRIFNGHMARWATVPAEEVFAEGMRAVEDFTREFYAPSEARRQALIKRYEAGEISREELPFDVITMMLLEPGERWDRELRIRQAHMFLAASIHTTANSIAHTLTELLGWMAEHPEAPNPMNDVDFLRKVANESLRLHPSSPAVMRRAASDIILKSGRAIMAGDKVAVRLDRANRDAAVFGEDPEAFNPDRVVRRGVNRYGLAFGGGVHSCIGKPLVTTNEADSAEGEDGFQVQRAMIRLLSSYLKAGIRLDPAESPAMAPSGQVRYARYPVIFDAL